MVTHTGHSIEYAVQQVGTENQCFAYWLKSGPQPLNAEGGKGADRTMATALQHHQAAQRAGLQTTGTGSDLARHQCAGLRCAPATTWGLATTPDSLIKGGPLRSGWSPDRVYLRPRRRRLRGRFRVQLGATPAVGRRI